MICTFDTEGTTVTDARGTYGVMYYWDLCTLLGEPEDVYPETVTTLVCHDTGRDCTTLYNHLHTLLQYWEDCGDTVKVAVHNLTYDFGYIRHFITRVSDARVTVRTLSLAPSNVEKIRLWSFTTPWPSSEPACGTSATPSDTES